MKDVVDDLGRRARLARVAAPVSPDLDVAAVMDLAGRAPGGGAGGA